MDWEQRIERVAPENLELEMLDWKRHNWEIVALAPSSMHIGPGTDKWGFFPSWGRTIKVRDYLVVLKRSKSLPDV